MSRKSIQLTLIDPDDVLVSAIASGAATLLDVSLARRAVTIDMGDGEEVSCRFTISKPA
jgi:hypothetical protein